MGNTVNFMSLAQLLYFNCCDVNSLIRSNAVCNTVAVNKSFCKSTVLGEVLCEGKTNPYWLVYSSKNVLIFVSVVGSFLKGRVSPLHLRSSGSVIRLNSGNWLRKHVYVFQWFELDFYWLDLEPFHFWYTSSKNLIDFVSRDTMIN